MRPWEKTRRIVVIDEDKIGTRHEVVMRRHSWTYGTGVRWSRWCVICGAKQTDRKRAPKRNYRGKSWVYERVTTWPDGQRMVGPSSVPCPGKLS